MALPTGFTPDQESAYRGLLRTTLPNHPFLGPRSSFVNVVMRDFTYAWALDRSDPEQRRIVHEFVNRETYQVSPMLGRFHLVGDDPDVPPVCRAEDIGLIYESLVAEYSVEKRPSLIISRAEGELEATMLLGGGESTGSLVRVLDPDVGIRFWRRLSNADIIGGLPVSLGVPGSSFTLGPKVHIHASLFDVTARHVRVSRRSGDEVRIVADDGYVSSSAQLEIDTRGTGFFGVFWEDLRFPWAQYASDPPPPPEVDEWVLLGDFVLLIRLTTALPHRRSATINGIRRHSRARTDDLLETFIGSSGRMHQLIDYMIDCEIITNEGGGYRINVRSLNERHMRPRSLRARYLTPPVREFLTEFNRSLAPDA
jgi:hypothetical protein